MRTALIFLICAGTVLAANPYIYIDLLMPADPAARDGDAADDFEAAQRLVQSDLDALIRAPEEQERAAAERLLRSLELLGDIGGYDAVRSGRSAGMYWELVAFAESFLPFEAGPPRRETMTVTVRASPHPWQPPDAIGKVVARLAHG